MIATALRRLRSHISYRRLSPGETAAQLRALAGRIETGLAMCGTLTFTDTRRPTMDLEIVAILDHLAAAWRRHAEVTKRNPGQLTPAEVYGLCADHLEARVRRYVEEKNAKERGLLV